MNNGQSMKQNNIDCIIYIHGFLSQGPSSKVSFIKKHFPDIEVLEPKHNCRANTVYDNLNSLIKSKINESASNLLLVGTSLGGFWANYFAEKYNLCCVIINPAIAPSVTLKKYEGKIAQETEWTIEDTNSYKSFESPTPKMLNRILLLSEDDQVIPYNLARDYFANICPIKIYPEGGHRFSNYDAIVEAINNLLSC